MFSRNRSVVLSFVTGFVLAALLFAALYVFVLNSSVLQAEVSYAQPEVKTAVEYVYLPQACPLTELIVEVAQDCATSHKIFIPFVARPPQDSSISITPSEKITSTVSTPELPSNPASPEKPISPLPPVVVVPPAVFTPTQSLTSTLIAPPSEIPSSPITSTVQAPPEPVTDTLFVAPPEIIVSTPDDSPIAPPDSWEDGVCPVGFTYVSARIAMGSKNLPSFYRFDIPDCTEANGCVLTANRFRGWDGYAGRALVEQFNEQSCLIVGNGKGKIYAQSEYIPDVPNGEYAESDLGDYSFVFRGNWKEIGVNHWGNGYGNESMSKDSHWFSACIQISGIPTDSPGLPVEGPNTGYYGTQTTDEVPGL